MAGRNRLRGLLDAAATIGTSAAAEPLAGLAGLYGLVTGGVDEGVRRIERTRDKVTYRPGADGQAYLGRLQHLLAPVTNAIESGKSGLGDAAYRVTGSPAAAAAAYTAPDALLSLVGARPALAAGRATQAAAGRAVRTAASGPTMGTPASQLGIFAGKGAKTADLDAMQRAATRLAAGDDPRVVWRDEGWMRGPDGHMRFEIDDRASEMAGRDMHELVIEAVRRGEDPVERMRELRAYEEQYGPIQRPYHRQGHTRADLQEIGNVYNHAPLGDAYPDLFSYGKYQRREDLGIGEGAYAPEIDAVFMGPAIPDVARSVMAHELQHAVQGREGFDLGTTPGVLHNTDSPDYWRLAAEAEARAVQKRLDYTPEQRRAIYPMDDYDVPLNELIITGQR